MLNGNAGQFQKVLAAGTWIWPTKVLLKVVSARARGDKTSFMQW